MHEQLCHPRASLRPCKQHWSRYCCIVTTTTLLVLCLVCIFCTPTQASMTCSGCVPCLRVCTLLSLCSFLKLCIAAIANLHRSLLCIAPRQTPACTSRCKLCLHNNFPMQVYCNVQEDHGVQVQALQSVPRSICSLLKVSLPDPVIQLRVQHVLRMALTLHDVFHTFCTV